MRRRPFWKAAIPPRTSLATARQVAASAAIEASGSSSGRAGTTRIRRVVRRASHSSLPTRSRTRPRPPGTSIASGS